MNSAEGSGSSMGAPLPGPKVSTVECRKSLEAGLDQLPAVRLLVDVGDGDEAVGDGLVDDGGAHLGRDLQARLRHLVDPHLDEVDPLAGQGADHLARLVRRGGLLGARVEAARVREAAAGREQARRVGAAGVGLEHQLHLLGVVGADAARGGDAVVELRPHHLQGRVGVGPVVGVHVRRARG